MKRITYYAPTKEYFISSVRVESGIAHDVVSLWNRGGHAGALMVKKGDGVKIANTLIPTPSRVDADDV